MVSLRFSCDVGWQRSGREGWPSCMIKSRRGGRERRKGGRESDSPFACTHSGRSQVFFLVRRVVSCCVHTLPRRQCVSFLPSLSCPPPSFDAVSMYIESFHVSSLITLFTTRHTGNVSRSQRNLRLEGYIHTHARPSSAQNAEGSNARRHQ